VRWMRQEMLNIRLSFFDRRSESHTVGTVILRFA